jgi:hypothetical protein
MHNLEISFIIVNCLSRICPKDTCNIQRCAFGYYWTRTRINDVLFERVQKIEEGEINRLKVKGKDKDKNLFLKDFTHIEN